MRLSMVVAAMAALAMSVDANTNGPRRMDKILSRDAHLGVRTAPASDHHHHLLAQRDTSDSSSSSKTDDKSLSRVGKALKATGNALNSTGSNVQSLGSKIKSSGGILPGIASVTEDFYKNVKANRQSVLDANGGKDPKIDSSGFQLPRINKNNGHTIFQDVKQIMSAPGASPTVNLTQGNYVGIRSNPLFQQEWYMGIPFAQAPTGDLRFRSPQEYQGQKGKEYPANLVPASCWQPNDYLIHYDDGDTVNRRDEDCLTLNVYSPIGSSKRNNGKLPVLFWIFGGGEIGGSSNTYNASALVLQSLLMAQPIIVVTPQYRLNSFGWLAGKKVTEGEDGAALNPGLQDVTLALNWVKDNIADFGGDPDKITIAGQSSGAFNTGAQLLKDGKPGADKPVYRAAAMISGTPMTEPAPKSDSDFAETNFQRVANAVGCSGDKATIACLRGVDAKTLAQAAFYPSTTANPSYGYILGPYYYAGNQPFQPTADGVYHRDGAGAQIARGEFPDVPVMTGNVKDEGTIFVSQSMNADGVADNIKTLSFPDPTTPGADSMVKSWLEKYLDSPDAGAPYYPAYTKNVSRFGQGNQFERLASVLGDAAFQSKRRYMVEQLSQKNKSPVWSYHFNETTTKPDPEGHVGVTHGSDPTFWFAAYNFAPDVDWLPATLAGTAMSKALVSFVHNMDPNFVGLPYWPKYDTENKYLMSFRGVQKLIKDDFRPYMSLFTSSASHFKATAT